MKKLISKLFERLGYVPKSILRTREMDMEKLQSRNLCQIMTVLKGKIKAGCYWCKINETQYRYVVYITNESENFRSLVKAFTSTDAEYSKICAEDLVEMLNKNE